VARAQGVDWDLHWTIVASLNNAIIADAYRVNSIKVRLIRQEQTLLSGTLVLPVMREHLAIIAAIETRDPRPRGRRHRRPHHRREESGPRAALIPMVITIDASPACNRCLGCAEPTGPLGDRRAASPACRAVQHLSPG
jgi:hypothetical protein